MYLAERAGFEPAIGGNPILAFQASAFDHSATSPALKTHCPGTLRSAVLPAFTGGMTPDILSSTPAGPTALWAIVQICSRQICASDLPRPRPSVAPPKAGNSKGRFRQRQGRRGYWARAGPPIPPDFSPAVSRGLAARAPPGAPSGRQSGERNHSPTRPRYRKPSQRQAKRRPYTYFLLDR